MNFKDVKLFLSNNSPTILTCASIVGVISTVITASQDTIKAQDILHKSCPRDRKEAAKITWKCYIPTAISAMSTIGCIVGSHYCSSKQKKALTSAYLLSQATLQEYQRKVIERIGKNKERDIQEEVAKGLADRQMPIMGPTINNLDVIETGHGNSLFYDSVSERYFKSDLMYLQKIENDINRDIMTEMYFDWNEILYRIGQPYKEYGDTLIVDIDHPLEFKPVPEIMENGQVRIVLTYKLYPKVLSK